MLSPAGIPLRELLDRARRGERTLIMGVINITPDSFSDGGKFLHVENAVAHAQTLAAEGADILDIGGESTRPATFRSAAPLSMDEEWRRVGPVIAACRAALPHIPLSIDTYKADIARRAVEAGADLVNDISALRADPDMAGVVSATGVPVALMHLPGLPTAIPPTTDYGDVVLEVRDHLETQAAFAEQKGIARESILIDPGIGFGKTPVQNLEILRRLREITDLPYPMLIGTSRKSTIGKVLGDLPPEERLEGTAATVALSIAYGAAMVRVHDVRQMVRVARMTDAVVRGWKPPE